MTLRILLSFAMVLYALPALSQPERTEIPVPEKTESYKLSKAAAPKPVRNVTSALKQEKLQVKAHDLNEKRIKGLTYITGTGAKRPRFEQIAAHFSSQEEIAGTIWTALVANEVASVPAAQRAQAAKFLSEELKKQGMADVSDAQLLQWAKALPPGLRQVLSRTPREAMAKEVSAPLEYATKVTTPKAWTDLVGPIPGPALTSIDCSKPISSATWSTSIGDSFTWSFSIRYPCGLRCSWSGCSIRWCTKTVSLTFGIQLGCSVGAQVSCCGAQAWGSCSANLCVAGICAGCSGGVAGGALSVTQIPGACAYGLPLVVTASCSIAGQNVFSASYQLSPYATTGPCPPAGACP